MEVANIYNDLPLHMKEAVNMPMRYVQLSVEQNLLLEELYEAVKFSVTGESLESIKDAKEELKAVVAELGSIVDEL
jgi:hypothetical protein